VVAAQPQVALDEAQRAKLLSRALLAKAARAREGDPVAFAELVMRAGKGSARLAKCAAVHELMMMFTLYARDLTHKMPGRAVIIAPSEHGKSWSISECLTLRRIALFPETRGVIVSNAAGQACKTLNTVRGYIESSAELQLVAPGLSPSRDSGDQWTQHAITVARQHSRSHDPTLQAVGFRGKLLRGSRQEFIVVDDLLTLANASTKTQRDQVNAWVKGEVLDRALDGAHTVVLNAALHPDDLPHLLISEQGWPGLIMSAYGQVQVFNTDFGNEGEPGEDLLEPEYPGAGTYVLSKVRRQFGHDPDRHVLFPEAFSHTRLEWIRTGTDAISFARNYLSECRDDNTAYCKQADVDACLKRGQQIGLRAPLHAASLGAGVQGSYQCTGQNPIFICVDLAFKVTARNDKTAIAVVELVPSIDVGGGVIVNGLRVLLDLELGRWAAPVTLDKIMRKVEAYGRANVTVVVEDNGAQAMMRQFIYDRAKHDKVPEFPVKPFTTDKNKTHMEYGVPRVFWEMGRGAWAWPNINGRMVAALEDLRDDCLNYVPDKHTGDALMSIYFARDQCDRLQSIMSQGARDGKRGGFAANLMAR
jgi:hypothetical protein